MKVGLKVGMKVGLKVGLVVGLAGLAGLQVAAGTQNIAAELARAETLYYEARFEEAVAVLRSVEPTPSQDLEDPRRLEDATRVKLLLAVSHVGLDQLMEARARFAELLEIDPAYVLDEQMFAPKVVTLFEESRATFEERQCLSMCRATSRQLELADAEFVRAAVAAAPSCECMAATALDASEFFFTRGIESFGNRDSGGALENFRHALGFNGEHPSAADYIARIEDDLRSERARMLNEWESRFAAGTYEEAVAPYEQLLALDSLLGGVSESELAQLRSESVPALRSQLQSWRQACTARDASRLEGIVREVAGLVPDSALAEELTSRMSCAIDGCFQMGADSAIARIVSQVPPEIPSAGLGTGFTVLARLHIGEDGAVAVQNFEAGNAGVNASITAISAAFGGLRTALEQWRFAPVVIGSDRRCVETALSFQGSSGTLLLD